MKGGSAMARRPVTSTAERCQNKEEVVTDVLNFTAEELNTPT
jgi:hypothetical protein